MSSCEILYGSSDDEDSFHSIESEDKGVKKVEAVASLSPLTVPGTPEVLIISTPTDTGSSSSKKNISDYSEPESGNLPMSSNSKKSHRSDDKRMSNLDLRQQYVSAATPLSSHPPRKNVRDNRETGKHFATAEDQPILAKGLITSTPLLSNRKMVNLDLDLTEIIEDPGNGGHLDVSGTSKSSSGQGSSNLSKNISSNSPDSDCELLDDQSYSDENGAVGGPAVNHHINNKQSPDIDALTEKLRKQHLADKKPLVKFLEEPPPNPFQAAHRPQELDEWRGNVADTIRKIAKAIETMPDSADKDSIARFSPPKNLRAVLYPHQIYGAKWMWWREHQYPGGGILADEMGLGKTIISIALILMGKENGQDEDTENWYTPENKKLIPTSATLVICPVGCMGQWENELRSKAKRLKVTIFHGSNRTRSAALLSQNDVVITSYPTVGSEIPKLVDDPYDRCNSPLIRLHWERVILDEGHIIRNPKTLGAQAICRLNARHRWVVTGTPVHNKAEDFFSLMKFLQLKPFDDPAVWKHWIGMKFVPQSNKERLNIIGTAMILRRTKDDVQKAGGSMASIPPKTVDDVVLELQESERLIYDHLENFAKQQFKNFLEAQQDRQHALQGAAYTYEAGKAKKGKKGVDQAQDQGAVKFSHFFALLTRLRQSSVLPFLIQTMLDDGEDGDETETSYDELMDPINAKNPAFAPGFKSSKIRAVMNDLKVLRKEAEIKGVPMDKVIIVSQWTKLLDIVSQHLKKKGYTYASITGADTVDERTNTMSTFNANPKRPQVLLLSMAAGGVGLNLVGANHVFFLEPHWNPMMERQAQDRVHRFGQTKSVFIKRYIMKDTIESRVLDLQSKKIELSDGLMDKNKKGSGAGLNVADMRTLFGV